MLRPVRLVMTSQLSVQRNIASGSRTSSGLKLITQLVPTQVNNYCIGLYTEGRLDRYHIGIPRENPKSALNLG